MSYLLFIHPLAEEDIRGAYLWYEEQQKGLGEDFFQTVEDILNDIRENPRLYAEVYHGLRRGLTRRFPYGLFYREERDRIVVVAVFHVRRDPSLWELRARAQ